MVMDVGTSTVPLIRLVAYTACSSKRMASPLWKSYDTNPSRASGRFQSTSPHRWNAMAVKTGPVLISNANLYEPKYFKSSKRLPVRRNRRLPLRFSNLVL